MNVSFLLGAASYAAIANGLISKSFGLIRPLLPAQVNVFIFLVLTMFRVIGSYAFKRWQACLRSACTRDKIVEANDPPIKLMKKPRSIAQPLTSEFMMSEEERIVR